VSVAGRPLTRGRPATGHKKVKKKKRKEKKKKKKKK
jgi:hypothetical protein